MTAVNGGLLRTLESRRVSLLTASGNGISKEVAVKIAKCSPVFFSAVHRIAKECPGLSETTSGTLSNAGR